MPWLLRFLYHLLEPGAAFHPLECVLNYVLPAAFWLADGDWGARLAALVIWNATMQLALFVVLVNVPTFLTGHMSYVDIGWPTGLVLLGANALALGEAPLVHRLAVCVPMLIHGLRMCLGAWFKFYMLPLRRSGDSSPLGFYFLRCFKEDLSRYAYAKDRWVEYLGPSAERFWWLKQQQDTLMQAYANSVVLAGPVFLVATNAEPSYSVGWALVGSACWACCWILENTADLQMAAFVRKAKKDGDRTAVVGTAPYDGPEFWLWRLSRHPNYFFEWACWVSFVVIALPAFAQFAADQGGFAAVAYAVLLLYCPRMFYDCLLYWTGAAPAEARSVTKRPKFRQHQAKTRVFFPFEMPTVPLIGWPDHHRSPGWPLEG